MASRRKFRVGPVVHNLEEVFQHDYFMIQQERNKIRQGSKWKTVHGAFVRSWQVQFCYQHIQRGYLRVAERLKNSEYYAGMTDDELLDMLETDVCEFCEGKKTVIGSCEGQWCEQALAAWKEAEVK